MALIPNPEAKKIKNYKKIYKLIGQLTMNAFLNKKLNSLSFTNSFIKYILG